MDNENVHRILVLLIAVCLAGCSSGAVVFAPTPPPPDVSPLRYDHPGGAFSVIVPRNWSVYTQNTITLAAASFAPPGADEPPVHFAVMNLGKPVDSAGLGDLINQYQKQIRPDVTRYTEVERQAMGDGSWRLTGTRATIGGRVESVNTFIQQSGTFIGIAEVVLPNNTAQIAELQGIINSFSVNTSAGLQPSNLTTLGTAAAANLEILHVSTWTTPSGVFFITGEVANYNPTRITDVPVRAVLRTPDGLAVAEAVDTVMAYSIPPGGFAPFSLRFGQGQPALTNNYELYLGNADWKPDANRIVYGQDQLKWDDQSQILGDGRLIISGSITNVGDKTLTSVRAIVTIFDKDQHVIAAGFSPASSSLAPKATTPFSVIVPERGGEGANYIVNVEGLP
jgi:hypothetical protein